MLGSMAMASSYTALFLALLVRVCIASLVCCKFGGHFVHPLSVKLAVHKVMQRRCDEPTVHHCTFGQLDIHREAHSLA